MEKFKWQEDLTEKVEALCAIFPFVIKNRWKSRLIYNTEKLAAYEGLSSVNEDVFWRSSRRAFTREELETRSVPRARGVWILDLVGSSPNGYPPSRITSILRGESRFPSSRRTELSGLPHWGLLEDIDYGEILQDVLAMWAKGYLQPCSGSSKRLELTGKGHEVLERRRTGEGSGVPPDN